MYFVRASRSIRAHCTFAAIWSFEKKYENGDVFLLGE